MQYTRCFDSNKRPQRKHKFQLGVANHRGAGIARPFLYSTRHGLRTVRLEIMLAHDDHLLRERANRDRLIF